jgi:hypothetical protein
VYLQDFHGSAAYNDLDETAPTGIQGNKSIGNRPKLHADAGFLRRGRVFRAGKYRDQPALIGQAIRGRREQAILSVKFGALRDPNGAFLGFDGRPAFVKTSLAYTLRRPGVDYVDLYYPWRVDPSVPIEEPNRGSGPDHPGASPRRGGGRAPSRAHHGDAQQVK